MIETVFFEEEVFDHPTSIRVRKALPRADWFPIRSYQELFNKRHQNFRLQKKRPELILAKKHSNFVLPTPPGFGMNTSENFYFSHMYNCLYDCKYCFLQGMYNSANFVLFVNYEDFFQSISVLKNRIRGASATFFSGYDCDSLAFDQISGFADKALDFFCQHPDIILELRTKSVSASTLLQREAISNCIIAFSLSPHKISEVLDVKAPSVARRVYAIKNLARHGWKIGLRFDPLIYYKGWEDQYASLVSDIMKDLIDQNIHSVSFGPLRFPKKMYKKIAGFYPNDQFYAFPLGEKNRTVSYGSDIEMKMRRFLERELAKYVSEEKIFQCVLH